jgi:hypothetical protein
MRVSNDEANVGRNGIFVVVIMHGKALFVLFFIFAANQIQLPYINDDVEIDMIDRISFLRSYTNNQNNRQFEITNITRLLIMLNKCNIMVVQFSN